MNAAILGGAVAVCCGGTVGAACVACGVFGGIAAGASIFGVMVMITELLASPVLVAGVLFVAMMATVVLVHGLFERSIRQAAKRRFRARLHEATNAEPPATAGTLDGPPADVRIR